MRSAPPVGSVLRAARQPARTSSLIGSGAAILKRFARPPGGGGTARAGDAGVFRLPSSATFLGLGKQAYSDCQAAQPSGGTARAEKASPSQPSQNNSTAPHKRRGCPTEAVPCRPDAQPRHGKHLPDGIARPIRPLSDHTQNAPAPENGSGVFPHPYIFSARGLQKGNHASRAFRRPVSGRFFCFPSPRPLFAVHRSAGFKSFPSGRAARAPRRGFRPPPRS